VEQVLKTKKKYLFVEGSQINIPNKIRSGFAGTIFLFNGFTTIVFMGAMA
jgi:hypothetical protein